MAGLLLGTVGDVRGPDPGGALDAGEPAPLARDGQVEEGESNADTLGHASAMLRVSL